MIHELRWWARQGKTQTLTTQQRAGESVSSAADSFGMKEKVNSLLYFWVFCHFVIFLVDERSVAMRKACDKSLAADTTRSTNLSQLMGRFDELPTTTKARARGEMKMLIQERFPRLCSLVTLRCVRSEALFYGRRDGTAKLRCSVCGLQF